MLMPNITMNACGNYDGAKLVFKNLSEQTEKATSCNYNLCSIGKYRESAESPLHIPLKSGLKQSLYQKQQPILQRDNLLSPPRSDKFLCNISTKSLSTDSYGI